MYRRNRIIVGLKNNNDVWCTFDEQIYEIMVSFYKNLFTSAHLPASLQIVLDAISPSSTDEMNADLIKVFTRAEVEFALKHMEPLKAPAPDDMPPIFFQSFWSLVGDDVSTAVLDCLNNCHIPSELNLTYVNLIPKVKRSK